LLHLMLLRHQAAAARRLKSILSAVGASHQQQQAAPPAASLATSATTTAAMAATAAREVAVVGGGVSGLFCASVLSNHGHKVTVFDLGKHAPGLRVCLCVCPHACARVTRELNGWRCLAVVPRRRQQPTLPPQHQHTSAAMHPIVHPHR
jgi:hypothetical protein